MAVDSLHLVRERIDLRDRDGEVRVVLIGQPNAMGFGGKPEVGGVAIQRRQLASLGDLDRPVELVRLQQLVPEPLRVQPDRLDLDPAPTGLDGQHFDRLGPVRPFEDRAFRKLV